MANDNATTPGVIPFKPRVVTSEVTPSNHNAADPNIVDTLERYLKAAMAGKIRFVAVAMVDDQGIAISNWETAEGGGAQLVTQALGAVSYLNYRFNHSVHEGAVESDAFQD